MLMMMTITVVMMVMMVMMGKRTARSFTEVAALKMHHPYKFEIQGLNRFNVTFSFLGRRRFNATFSSLVRCQSVTYQRTNKTRIPG